jgi:hypothetical protein
MTHPIDTRILANGLTVEFFDLSNRYYGDYHRVCIEVRCRIVLPGEHSLAAADPEKKLATLGDQVVFVRSMEKMGVAGEALETVRAEMIDGFARSTFSYLGAEGFPALLMAREKAKKRGGRRLFVVPE